MGKETEIVIQDLTSDIRKQMNMLIPFTQAAQTLAELHETFVWRCHAE
jgi:hypothetical protein